MQTETGGVGRYHDMGGGGSHTQTETGGVGRYHDMGGGGQPHANRDRRSG